MSQRPESVRAVHILESTLKSRLLLRAPRELPDLRLFVRQVMRVRVPSKTGERDRVVQVGLKGQSDIYGLWRGGRHIEIELKAAKGRLSHKQRVWQVWCERWGVPHVVLSGLASEDVEATVTRWLRELQSPF